MFPADVTAARSSLWATQLKLVSELIMLKFLFLYFLVMSPGIVFGTVQQSDELLYNGNAHRVYYFKLSKSHIDNLKAYENKHSVVLCRNTANWDGVYVKLSIQNRKLYLHDLKTGCISNTSPSIEELFGIIIPSLTKASTRAQLPSMEASTVFMANSSSNQNHRSTR